jgi:acyl-CoA synthetase (AMP-forming)/AMP-acid ligase II
MRYKCKRYQVADVWIAGRPMTVFKDRPCSLREILKRAVAESPEQKGFICGERRWTFEHFGRLHKKLAASLQRDFGVRKGDRVAILMESDLEYPLSLFAIAEIGAIGVPLNSRLTGEELAYEIQNSEAGVLLIDEGFWAVMEPFRRRLKTLKHVFIRGETRPEGGGLPFSLLLEEGSQEPKEVDIREDDVAMLMYTSGTTGHPKGAMQIHRGIVHACMLMDEIFESNPETDRLLNVMPMFHSAGTIMCSFAAVFMRVPCLYMHKYKTESVLEVIETERITLMVHVPTIYWLLVNHPEFQRYDLRSLRVGITGGAPKSREAFELIRNQMPWTRFVDTFGMTETHTLDFILEHEEMAENMDSVGRTVPIEEVRIVDRGGKDCGPNRAGEILIKGPKIVAGYWKNPRGTAEAIADGWLHTGDVGKIDDRGFVYVLDRIKDMINRGGENIYSVEVENALCRHPGVAEAAVIGVPDAVFGEAVKAYILLKEGATLTEDGLKDHCREHLADYKIPKHVEFVADLPRNQAGKIMKKALRERYGKARTSFEEGSP